MCVIVITTVFKYFSVYISKFDYFHHNLSNNAQLATHERSEFKLLSHISPTKRP